MPKTAIEGRKKKPKSFFFLNTIKWWVAENVATHTHPFIYTYIHRGSSSEVNRREKDEFEPFIPCPL